MKLTANFNWNIPKRWDGTCPIKMTLKGDYFIWKGRFFMRVTNTEFLVRKLHLAFYMDADKVESLIKENIIIQGQSISYV